MKTCLECKFHKVIMDPDPFDWFCDDDQAVLCLKTENPKVEKYSYYMSDREEFRSVTKSCRPYSLENESSIPKWCPLKINDIK